MRLAKWKHVPYATLWFNHVTYFRPDRVRIVPPEIDRTFIVRDGNGEVFVYADTCFFTPN